MLTKRCKLLDRRAGCDGTARSLRVLQAPAVPLRPAAARPSHPLTVTASAASAAAAAPGFSAPLSFRAITTDPSFSPATEGCQQYLPGPPQLLSRHITGNPLHGLVAWLEAQAAGIDRGFAAAMDGWPLAQAGAAALTAALTYLGLHPMTFLGRGLPDPWVDWLEVQLGDWAVPLVAVVALAVGAVAALWQLRTWMAGQLALVRLDDALDAAAAARAAEAEAADAGADAGAGSEGPFARLVPAPLRGLFESDWKPTDRTWLYAIMAARLSTLLTAASSLLAGATAQASAYAGLCFAASLLPAVLPHVRSLFVPTVSYSLQLAAPLLLADAGFLMALAPAAPATMRAAATVALAAGLAVAAVAAAASPRLEAVRAAAGDVATFNITIRLPTSGTLIDTTVGHRALEGVVGTKQEKSNVSEETERNPAEQTPDTVLSYTDPRIAGSTAGVIIDPQARMRPLQNLLAAAAVEGMFVGQRRTVSVPVDVTNDASKAGGGEDVAVPYSNPGLVWWQSTDDLRRKVGASNLLDGTVSPGEVFWYPVGSLVSELGALRLSTVTGEANDTSAAAVAGLPGVESWGPVEVVAVAGDWLQLDANCGLKAGVADVEIELLDVRKRAKPAAA